MTERSAATTIDEYIAEFPPEVQAKLTQMRQLIHSLVPEAVESISYAIPTFDLDGKHLVHFAAFKNHIGFYPTPNGMEEFAEELSAFKSGKGSAQFPLDDPLPTDLITQIVEFRVANLRGTHASKDQDD